MIWNLFMLFRFTYFTSIKRISNIEVFYKKQPVYNKQMVEREGKGIWRYKF